MVGGTAALTRATQVALDSRRTLWAEAFKGYRACAVRSERRRWVSQLIGGPAWSDPTAVEPSVEVDVSESVSAADLVVAQLVVGDQAA